MPFNLIKKYNELLELGSFNSFQRKESLMRVFDRDITNNASFKFHGKQITPTPKDGEMKMSTLFSHLTTVVVDKRTRKREFDNHRAIRLHWLKHHLDEKISDNILIYSVKEPDGFRTYIYNVLEKYVIVLEPLRNKGEYYLLSAYHVRGKDAQREKFVSKYKKRRLDDLL